MRKHNNKVLRNLDYNHTRGVDTGGTASKVVKHPLVLLKLWST